MLLQQIESYLAEHQEPPTRFGRRVVKDPRFVLDLRAGRQPGERNVTRVRSALESPPPPRPLRLGARRCSPERTVDRDETAALLADIEAFLIEYEMPASMFSRNSVNSPGLVTALRSGRALRVETRAAIRRFMASIASRA